MRAGGAMAMSRRPTDDGVRMARTCFSLVSNYTPCAARVETTDLSETRAPGRWALRDFDRARCGMRIRMRRVRKRFEPLSVPLTVAPPLFCAFSPYISYHAHIYLRRRRRPGMDLHGQKIISHKTRHAAKPANKGNWQARGEYEVSQVNHPVAWTPMPINFSLSLFLDFKYSKAPSQRAWRQTRRVAAAASGCSCARGSPGYAYGFIVRVRVLALALALGI